MQSESSSRSKTTRNTKKLLQFKWKRLNSRISTLVINLILKERVSQVPMISNHQREMMNSRARLTSSEI